MRFLFTIALAMILAACGSNPVTLNYGDKENPNRVTSVTGLKSHDAANTITYGAYTDAQIKRPQKAVCSLKAATGKELKIDGLSEFTCWAPETDQMAKPVQAEGELMQAARAGRELVGGTVKDVTPALAIGAALSDRKDARAAATEQSQIAADTERARDAAQAAQAGELIEALREKPQFFVLPAGAAPVATPTE